MSYVDGYLLAVPVANKGAYREMAEEVAQILKEYGALSVVECWGDDVPEGETTSFPMAVKLKQGNQAMGALRPTNSVFGVSRHAQTAWKPVCPSASSSWSSGKYVSSPAHSSKCS